MHVLSTQNLTLLTIIVGYSIILCAAVGNNRPWERLSSDAYTKCIVDPKHCVDFRDCQLPAFECVRPPKCVPPSRVCNGINECPLGSDEWRCVYTSTEYTKTSTMLSESIESHSYITSNKVLQYTEVKTTPSTSTTTSVLFPESEDSSTSTSSTMVPDSELNTAPSSSTVESTSFPGSESDDAIIKKKLLLAFRNRETEGNTSSSTTNFTRPNSSMMLLCPDNYCAQNAECIVIEGQYHCKCPSSFTGELCEKQLGAELTSHEYLIAIAILMALIILCLCIVSMCIHRRKRLSAWKSSDMANKALSQLTLTVNAI